MSADSLIQSLLNFIDDSPSPWHAVDSIKAQLMANQFSELRETDRWNIQPGGRHFVVRDGSSIIFFVKGAKPLLDTGFRIAGAHTDSPGLRIKPRAWQCKDGLARLNVEIYGSPILATFTDRDLSLAGRICYQNTSSQIVNRLVRFDAPLLRLPNLAIHLNRGVNEDGLKLQKQNELPLIFSTVSDQLPADFFLKLLEEKSGIQAKAILSWDLAVYDTQKGTVWGGKNEFYSDSQIDNLASCHAVMQALLEGGLLRTENTQICGFFDHEEIGSESKQGADGSFLADVMKRISCSEALDDQDYARALAKSFIVSADMAHAFHPNFPSAYDNEHKVIVNQGPVIKVNNNQRYSSEAMSEAIFSDWCRQAGVPFQFYSHRCDLPCGSTIGPIVSAKLGIRAIDIGNPMWAMHSIRESAGVCDHADLIKVLKVFFQSQLPQC